MKQPQVDMRKAANALLATAANALAYFPGQYALFDGYYDEKNLGSRVALEGMQTADQVDLAWRRVQEVGKLARKARAAGKPVMEHDALAAMWPAQLIPEFRPAITEALITVDRTVLNLTPHAVNLVGVDRFLSIPVDGDAPRVTMDKNWVDNVTMLGATSSLCVPLNVTRTGELTGLPETAYGVTLIVSRMVIDAAEWRGDLVAPDDIIRDGNLIVGCRALSR